MFQLTGKTALVTGASGGIGRAIALALASRSADVAVHFHQNEAAARDVQTQIETLGRRCAILGADIRDSKAFEELYARAESEIGPLDILVNNAGTLKLGFLAMLSESAFDDALQTNLKGAFLLSKRAARAMTRRKSGRIVNISSQAAQTGEIMGAHYSAAKAALLGLTKSAARELAPHGVTCNAICPGFVETPMLSTDEAKREKQRALVPLGRFGKPEEIAALCVYLCSDEAAYVTGQIFAVDGGLRM